MSLNTYSPGGFTTSLLIADLFAEPGASSDSIQQMTKVNGVTVAAALELKTTSGAFLLPRLTTAQQNALTPVIDGMMIYNTDNAVVTAYENGSWVPVGSGGSGSITSITQGANIVLTPSPITTTGSVALNPVLTSITSAEIGNLRLSTTANTISSTAALNLTSATATTITATSGNINLTPSGVVSSNGDIQLQSGKKLLIFSSANTNRSSFEQPALSTDINYKLPTTLPNIGTTRHLVCDDTGNLNWVVDSTGTVTQINVGSNLSGGPTITTSGTISLSNTISGLTSIGVGSLSLSGTSFTSSGALTVTTVSGLALNSSGLTVGSQLQIRSGFALSLSNTGNTFATNIVSGNVAANATYQLPLTVPASNGQVLSCTTAGIMSWSSASGGTVTSITSGSNITCTPNPIIATGTVALNSAVTGLTSIAVGNISLSTGTITTASGDLTLTSAASTKIVLNPSLVVEVEKDLVMKSANFIQFYNATDTNYATIGGSNFSADVNYVLPTAGPSVNGQVLACTTAGTMSWASAGGAPTDATYITQTPNGTLSAEFALSTLGNGLLKNTTGTGVLSIATAGTDYYSLNNPTRIIDTSSTADANLFIGKNVGITATGSAQTNVGAGINCLSNLTSGDSNCAYGSNALVNATSAGSNACYGALCGNAITTGNSNSFYGAFCGQSITTSSNNSFFGQGIAPGINTIARACALGNGVTYSADNLDDSVALGYNAVIGTAQSIAIGSGAQVGTSGTRSIAIGYQAGINVPNAIRLGNAHNIGNHATPSYTFHLANVNPGGAGTSMCIFAMAPTSNVPATDVTVGMLYVTSGGALAYKGTSGTVTVIAPA